MSASLPAEVEQTRCQTPNLFNSMTMPPERSPVAATAFLLLVRSARMSDPVDT